MKKMSKKREIAIIVLFLIGGTLSVFCLAGTLQRTQLLPSTLSLHPSDEITDPHIKEQFTKVKQWADRLQQMLDETFRKISLAQFWTSVSGDDIYRVDGNVGIGTTEPSQRLHVKDAGGTVIAVEETDDDNWAMFSMGTDNAVRAAYMLAYGSTHSTQADELSIKNLYGGLNFFTGTGGDSTERLSIDSSGNVGIGATSPTAKLDVNSDILRLRTAKTPASAGADGNQGDICWDSGYIYVCIATNTWKRSEMNSW